MSCPKCAAESRLFRRRVARIAGMVLPGILLAVMPKCPMCFVAYAAAFTGIGLSVTAAIYLRSALILLCVACLTAVAISVASTLISRRSLGAKR
jgi:hypothetical protein